MESMELIIYPQKLPLTTDVVEVNSKDDVYMTIMD